MDHILLSFITDLCIFYLPFHWWMQLSYGYFYFFGMGDVLLQGCVYMLHKCFEQLARLVKHSGYSTTYKGIIDKRPWFALVYG